MNQLNDAAGLKDYRTGQLAQLLDRCILITGLEPNDLSDLITAIRQKSNNGDNQAKSLLSALALFSPDISPSLPKVVDFAPMKTEADCSFVSLISKHKSILAEDLQHAYELEEGIGHKQDFLGAAKIYAQSALEGDTDSAISLSHLMSRGFGITQDRQGALLLHSIASRDYLDDRAIWTLFALRYLGLSELIDTKATTVFLAKPSVRAYLHALAAHGHAIAAFELAMLTLVDCDNQTALDNALCQFLHAATLGFPPAWRVVAELIEVFPDLYGAEFDSNDLYKKAVDHGDIPSQIRLALLAYVRPELGDDIWRSYLDSAHLNGSQLAKKWLMRCLMFAGGGIKADHAYRQEAIQLGAPDSYITLSDPSKHLSKDPRITFLQTVQICAQSWMEIPLERSAQMGNKYATFERAWRLFVRRGAQDYVKARSTYITEVEALDREGWIDSGFLSTRVATLTDFTIEAAALLTLPDAGPVDLKEARRLIEKSASIGSPSKHMPKSIRLSDNVQILDDEWFVGQMYAAIHASKEAHTLLLSACHLYPKQYVEAYLDQFTNCFGIFADRARYNFLLSQFRNLDNPKVQCALGSVLPPNEGHLHLERAFALGSAEAARKLGKIYALGIGVERDTQRAEKFFQEGAARGDHLSAHLGAFLDAIGMLPSSISADAWILVESLAREGHPACAVEAAKQWSKTRERTIDRTLHKNLSQSIVQALTLAAMNGHKEAWRDLCREAWAYWSDSALTHLLAKEHSKIIIGGAFCGDSVADHSTLKLIAEFCIECSEMISKH